MRGSAAAGRQHGVLLAAALVVVMPTQSSAQTTSEKAIRARQSGYFLMGQQMSRISATVKGDQAFDKASLALSAELIDLVSRVVVDNYPDGSDKGSTKAKPGIWKETPRFKQLAQASQIEAAKLKAAVHSGEIEALKAAFGSTAKSCKACHDVFKE